MSNETDFKRYSTPFEDTETILEDIELDKAGMISFGINFLDDTFVGILKTDLVVLGGRSGGGKTELAMHIAQKCAESGKIVYYYALESEKKELGKRLMFKRLAHYYFADKSNRFDVRHGAKAPYVAYDRFRSGLLPELYKYVPESRRDIRKLDNLRTRYSTKGYGLKEFELDFMGAKADADLIILDHLHYLQLRDNNENSEYKKIVQSTREMSLEYGVPVILIAHINKADKAHPQLVPEQEDFHGTSDIVKIATKVISIASAVGKQNLYESIGPDGKPAYRPITISAGHPSYMKVAKYRNNGSMEAHTALLQFNVKTNTYGDKYYLGKSVKFKSEVTFVSYLDDQIPAWASHVLIPGPMKVGNE